MGWNVYLADGSLKTGEDSSFPFTLTSVEEGDTLVYDGSVFANRSTVKPPLYSAYRGSALNSTTTWTAIPWDNEGGDFRFDTTASSAIAVPENGTYEIIAQCLWASASGAQFNRIRIDAVGSERARNTIRGSTGNATQCTAIVTLSASDTVSALISSDATRAVTTGSQYTWIRIRRVF